MTDTPVNLLKTGVAAQVSDQRLDELIEEHTGYGADVPTGRVHSTFRMGELESVLREVHALRTALTASEKLLAETELAKSEMAHRLYGQTLAVQEKLTAAESLPIRIRREVESAGPKCSEEFLRLMQASVIAMIKEHNNGR